MAGELDLIDLGYQLGTVPVEETASAVPADKRNLILSGVPSDSEYTIEVTAYRSVDRDIAPNGVIESAPGIVPGTPYIPSPVVKLGSSVTLSTGQILNASIAEAKAEGTAARLELTTAVTQLNLDVADAKQEGTDAKAAVVQARADLAVSIAAAMLEATQAKAQASQVRTDLTPAITQAQTDANAGKAAAAQAALDLGSEVTRAKADTASIRTVTTQIQTDVSGNTTAITNEATSRANADTALSNRTSTIEASVNTGPNSLTSLRSGITDEATARASADTAIATRTSTLEAAYSNATTGNLALSGKLTDEATARAAADSALVLRTSTLEATVNDPTKGNGALASKISDEALARSTADTTLANRTSTLESSVTQPFLNTNADFGNWTATVPAGWSVSANAAAKVAKASGGTSLQATSGTANFSVAADSVPITPGWYVLESDLALISGDFSSAGLGIYLFDKDGNQTTFQKVVTLATRVPDVVLGTTYYFRELVQITDTAAVTASVRATLNLFASGSYGNTRTAKSIRFDRLGLRVATAGEIIAQQAALDITAATARIATEETTRATADTALATRTSTLEASVNSGPNSIGSLRSAITDEASVRSSGDTTLGLRAAALESTVNDPTGGNAALKARVASEETTRATADTALASRTSTIEANVASGAGLPALNVNPAFSVWPDATIYPTGWAAFNGTGTLSRVVGETSPYALRLAVAAAAGSTTRSGLTATISALQYVVLEADALLNAGSLSGAGMRLRGPNNTEVNVQFLTDLDITDTVVGAGVAGTTYRFRKLVQIPTGWGTGTSFLWLMTAAAAYGSIAGSIDLTWYRASVRAATNAEVAAMRADTASTTALARITDEAAARVQGDIALATRTTALESITTDAANGNLALKSRISTEETTRTAADSALATRATNLEASVNTGPNSLGTLRSSISDEVSARTTAVSTIATRTTALESLTGDGTNGNTALKARIAAEETTRTTADTALADRSSSLESRAGSNGAVNTNPTFAQYSAASGVPDGWVYDDQTHGGATRVAGENGGYAMQLAGAAGVAAYASQQLAAITANSWWVIEADVKLTAGTLTGAGVLFRVGTSDNTIIFVSDKDSTDNVVGAGTVGTTYRFRKLVQAGMAAPSPTLYFMSHYAGFTAIPAANSLTWYRCAVRPASNAEIMALKADAALNTASTGVIARLTSEELTRATQNTALATRTTALESITGDGSNGNLALKARIATEETTRTAADSALATRTATLEAIATGTNSNTNLRGAITDEASARVQGDTAIATRTARLEASNAGRNIIAADAVNGLTDFVSARIGDPALIAALVPTTYTSAVVTDADLGPAIEWSPTARGHSIGSREVVRLVKGRVYEIRITYKITTIPTGGTVAFNGLFEWLTGTYAEISTTSATAVTTTTAGAWQELIYLISDTGSTGVYAWPDGALYMRPMHRLNVTADGTVVRTSRIQITDTTTDTKLAATITDETTARVTADSAIALRASALESLTGDAASGNNALKSRIATEETTRTNAVSALATRTSTLETNYQSATTGNVALAGKISDEATTRASADTAVANRTSTLEATAGNLTSRVSTTESAITTLNGKNQAYWKTQAVSGSNVASVTVIADSNNGGAVEIVGNVSMSGGLITPGTISARQLVIRDRAINFPQLNFEILNNTLYWTSGYLQYYDDSGNIQQITIAAGSTTLSGYVYVYWIGNQSPAATSLSVTNDFGVAHASNIVIIATWLNGTVAVSTNFGTTTINGATISTGTLNADRIVAGTITVDNLQINTAMVPGYVSLASPVTGTGGPSSGSVPSTGGGVGSGGAACVADTSYMPDLSGTGEPLAGDMATGDNLLLLNATDDGSIIGPIAAMDRQMRDCMRLTTASGITLVLSDDTPITLRGGVVVALAKSYGQEVPVQDGDEFRWEVVTSIMPVGPLPTTRIYANDHTYAAGEQSGRYIYTHNKVVNP